MTLHRQPAQLICHRCGEKESVPSTCPQCGSKALTHVGMGTEQLEEFFNQSFPNTPVIRIDRDSTQRKDSMRQKLDSLSSGEPKLLFGKRLDTSVIYKALLGRRL